MKAKKAQKKCEICKRPLTECPAANPEKVKVMLTNNVQKWSKDASKSGIPAERLY